MADVHSGRRGLGAQVQLTGLDAYRESASWFTLSSMPGGCMNARWLHECPVAPWMPGGWRAVWCRVWDGSKVSRSRHSLNFYVELDNKTIYGLKDNHGWSCGRHPMKEFQMSWSRAFTCLFTPLAGSRYQPTAPFPCTSLYGQNEANNSNHCILVHDWYYVKLITFKEAHLWWLTIS